MSTESASGMDDNDNERVPGKPHKPLDCAEELPTRRQSVQPRW